ncbi:alpha/beta hydrolase [Amaricoccus solimangrovi]|uniref:Alpha/beta hydrolase n=1 Tax=Amaricoccus solimangrovi TaxID=2589815 RepID=A0A501WLS0_9RHOB|nr:alpha/beta hydrolase [Amaricoccus solimangrovi]TPE48167.1 alpha/beta hydrolase [Amaricoccus solimangrovi]
MQTYPSYRDQAAWSRIQSHLPEGYRLAEADLPVEEIWSWRGHRIHLDRYLRPEAPARVILFHGVGTNGRQMTTILGHPLARSGIETVAIDMPGYGVTAVAPGATVTYDDWVQAGVDFVEAEMARDPRPVYLYGLSAGGMLTYHVACRARARVAGIIGMTFLDLRNREVALGATLTPLLGRLSLPMLPLGKLSGLRRLRLPMRLVGKMHALVNDRAAMRDLLADGSSAGNWVSMAFLESFMRPKFDVEPEAFDVCPVLLTQPAEDRWTPLWMSTAFLDRIRRVPVRRVMLENASHYPIEEPGLTRMRDAILDFIHATRAESGMPAPERAVA